VQQIALKKTAAMHSLAEKRRWLNKKKPEGCGKKSEKGGGAKKTSRTNTEP